MSSLTWPQAIGIIVAMIVFEVLGIDLERAIFWGMLFVGAWLAVYCSFQAYRTMASMRDVLSHRKGVDNASLLEHDNKVLRKLDRLVSERNSELMRWWIGRRHGQ